MPHPTDVHFQSQVSALLQADLLTSDHSEHATPHTRREFALALLGVLQNRKFSTLSTGLQMQIRDLAAVASHFSDVPEIIRTDLLTTTATSMRSPSPSVSSMADSNSVFEDMDPHLHHRSGAASAPPLLMDSVSRNGRSRSGSVSSESGPGSPSALVAPMLSELAVAEGVITPAEIPALAQQHYTEQARIAAQLVGDCVFLPPERQARMSALHAAMVARGGSPAEVDGLFAQQDAAQAAMVRLMLLGAGSVEGLHGCAVRTHPEDNQAKDRGVAPTIPLITLAAHGGRQIFAFRDKPTMIATLDYVFSGKLQRPTGRASAPAVSGAGAGQSVLKHVRKTAPARLFSSHLTTQHGNDKALKGATDVFHVVSTNKRHLRISPYLGMTAVEVADAMGLPHGKMHKDVPHDAVFGPQGVLYHMSGPRTGKPVKIASVSARQSFFARKPASKIVALGELYLQLPKDAHKADNAASDAIPAFTIGFESVPPSEVFGAEYTDLTGEKEHSTRSTQTTSLNDRSCFGGCKAKLLGQFGLAAEHVPAALGGVWVDIRHPSIIDQVRDAEATLMRPPAHDPRSEHARAQLVDILRSPVTAAAEGAIEMTATRKLQQLAGARVQG